MDEPSFNAGRVQGQRDMLAKCLRVMRRDRDYHRSAERFAGRDGDPGWAEHEREMVEYATQTILGLLRECKP